MATKLVRAIYKGDGERYFPGTGIVKPGDPVMVTPEQLKTEMFGKPPKTRTKAAETATDDDAGEPAEEA